MNDFCLLARPSQITNVYGTVKAYCTRVGEGPFPTEALDEMGETLRYSILRSVHTMPTHIFLNLSIYIVLLSKYTVPLYCVFLFSFFFFCRVGGGGGGGDCRIETVGAVLFPYLFSFFFFFWCDSYLRLGISFPPLFFEESWFWCLGSSNSSAFY